MHADWQTELRHRSVILKRIYPLAKIGIHTPDNDSNEAQIGYLWQILTV